MTAGGASWPVIGHGWAVAWLAAAIRRGRLHHAYLFTGPEGVGRTTLALAFAQALLCAEPNAPCGECASCRRVAANTHPDVRLVEPEKGVLRAEQVREVTREASLRPVEARWRVFVLTHLEQAHPAAANALLKTLEEPPAHVVLILTTAATDVIPATLVSRCQVLALRPVEEDVLVNALVERGVHSDRARLVARLSRGRPGLALRILEDESFWQRREDVFTAVKTLAENRSRWVRLEKASHLARLAPEEVAEYLDLLTLVYRDVNLWQLGQEELIVNLDKKAEVAALAAQLPKESVQRMVADLVRTRRMVNTPVNLHLALDVLFLHAPAHLPASGR